MKFSQALKMALSAIGSNKMRSFLTTLGIVIGVFAVTLLISLGQSASDEITGQIERMGTNLIAITIRQGGNISLGAKDIETILNMPEIAAITPVASGSVIAKHNGTMNISVECGNFSYAAIRNLTVTDGRFISTLDDEERLRVAVVGVGVADELFGRRDVLGESIMLDNQKFRIVGILEELGDSIMGSQDDRAVLPFSAAQRILNVKTASTYYVQAQSPDTVEAAVNKLEFLLKQKFGDDKDAFTVLNQSDLLKTVGNATATLSVMLGGIAGISLLVGGIGIMNIMLVSVTERTREIGIRKAIGAKRRDILGQFLIESVLLTALGGLIGVLLAYAGALLIQSLSSFTLVIKPFVMAVSVGFSALIGVAFGIYPANKAAGLNPIDALRRE